jgi:hypothetical protein
MDTIPTTSTNQQQQQQPNANNNESPIWLNDPTVLIEKESLTQLWPKGEYTLEENINAITRTILFATLFGIFFIRHKPVKLLITSIICVGVVMLYYKNIKENEEKSSVVDDKEGFAVLEEDTLDYEEEKKKGIFQEPSKNNPYGNVLPVDIKENPGRKPAPPAYNKDVDDEIKSAVKDNFNKKIFRDLGDNISFDESQRQFMTMPNTTIPNNQRGFAEFCYGNLASDKENGLEQF